MTMTMSEIASLKATTNRIGAKPQRNGLDCIFAPRSVALIGATETAGSVGRVVLTNLLRTPFGGPVYPINPKRKSVLGVPCWPDIASVPERVDLAVICTPAASVPDLIKKCADVGVGAAIIISAGFKEAGPQGVELERRVKEEARKAKLRIIGPNCLGVMSPLRGMNATFAAGIAKPGKVAFLSQSGALCTAVLDWSWKHNVGFSGFVSMGSMADVGFGDLIEYFGDDPATSSIIIYMESVGDVRSFMSAAREVALTKPIIVIKAGRTEAAAKAAVSHTGALTGSDDVLDSAFRRAGVLRVDRISDLFYMAEVLARVPKLAGNRLAIVTNAGGPGVLATDALVTGGGQLANISEETMKALNDFLPKAWSHNNPIDVLGDAPPDRYAKALEIVAKDPNNDGLLVVLTPQDMTDPTATAEHLVKAAAGVNKPVIASWMGAGTVQDGRDVLNKAGIPNFDYPDSAARAFNYMSQYAQNLKFLYETPAIGDGMGEFPNAHKEAQELIDAVRAQNRTVLTEEESKRVLKAYGIPVVETFIAHTADEAAKTAAKMKYPVVCKLLSRVLTHKTDVGGVQLNLRSEADVRNAFELIKQGAIKAGGEVAFDGVTVQRMVRLDGYELILGSSTDPQFGPVLMFGLGGQLVEVFRDRALGLPPLNDVLARRLIERTKIRKALGGVRGRPPVDIAELERILVRFSQLVVDQPWIKEVDINPLLASPEEIIGLDGRVVLHDPKTPPEKLPRPAIRPYPTKYISHPALRDGLKVTVRPIRPEDEPLMVEFHKNLSEETVRFRYFSALSLGQRVGHERLVKVCLSDYDRQMALVCERTDEKTGKREIIGVGRLKNAQGAESAEFAVIVSDQWQHKGVGTLLMESLVQVARDEKLEHLTGDILADNMQMLRVCERVGFTLTQVPEEQLYHAEMKL